MRSAMHKIRQTIESKCFEQFKDSDAHLKIMFTYTELKET